MKPIDWENKTKWNGDCLEWTGAKFTNGYGKVTRNGKELYTHRLAKNYFGEGHVCHECNNKACVNTDHLYVGNPTTNAQDAIKAGTHCSLKSTKLTPADVCHAILLSGWGYSQREIANIFGVTKQAIQSRMIKENA